ncbi:MULTISPECIES: PadR family transcriptional regulator [Romboutsia]|uniref:Transcriptional regulator, PadR-like n=1 Tax=Romboutsia hominis TaxID=1507512 RepID=A0A2P2BU38_9FIRM|nr:MULTISPECIES: helix-turn-helix transcriptional regulator [Romboutsia]MCH1959830.1 helix-turn-helix transcriptional regulator [Romboutsia hominis]MCH1969747.1 helix-turn-helix transcriptional regulator [Romboutsia hominis]MDB8791557.1 helix-turn-helix transcriptional regulator [Romboutsia sp. 1001216sp1]MDB8792586.1 helix-turn-helix transcriptional regulator [Romboutsia sp. 1001216sp1]MDB8796247.1 helix-turn-helix transcriptional regulator [Romboutsia sp. 1001216sp1]
MRDNVKGGALTETTLFILLALYKPNHGYGIMQFIELKTSGRLSLGAGTLYGAINTLLKKGWIEPYESKDDSRKKEYLITSKGKIVVENEIARLNDVLNISLKIVGDDKI